MSLESEVDQKYYEMIKDVYYLGDSLAPRGMKIKELRNVLFTLDDITQNVITLPYVKTNVEYANEELMWYLSGSDRIDFSPLIKKVWEKYSDDGETVNSAYGNRIFGRHEDFIDQWEWVVDELENDPDSRRAVINLNYCGDKKETKDNVCTMYIQAFVRDEKLEWTAAMRSNDAYYGFRNDMFCFTSMQKMMADELNLGYGPYNHFAGSMHIYEKDFEKIEKLIDKVKAYDRIRMPSP